MGPPGNARGNVLLRSSLNSPGTETWHRRHGTYGRPYTTQVSVMSSSQHKLCAAVLAVAVGVAGCAGNGQGLNATGQPIGSSSGGPVPPPPSGPVTADFQSIQQNVFTPICSPCHSGAGAPEGLMLDAAHSYNLLVGVPSTEVPSLNRVKAGDPNSSYIIVKLTNAPGIVGRQMPLNENPLPQSTIAAISQWITDGAPQGTTSAPASVNAMQKIQELANTTPAPFNVTQTSPVDQAVADTPVSHIMVAFNHEVDASLVNYTTLMVDAVPGSAGTNTPAVHLPSHAALADGNPKAIIITPAAPLLPGTYRVTVRGTGGGGLADLNAQVLGSDYSFTFTVDASP
jgi:Bacterial Ig-like domain